MNFMNTLDDINNIINAIKRIVEENQTANPDNITESTSLYGKSGILDSLGLVQLIAELEDEILAKTGRVITIADERAMSMKFSPFRNVSALTNYIHLLLKEQND